MTGRTLDNKTRYTLLRHLETNPGASRRELATQLGISDCLKALLDKGHIKAGGLKDSRRKHAYVYKLTPAGIAAGSQTPRRFLACKKAEFEHLAEKGNGTTAARGGAPVRGGGPGP